MAAWPVKPHNLFKIYMPEEEDLADLLGYILLEAACEATVEDIFQVCVRGDPQVTVRITLHTRHKSAKQ
jgi:hypothetical protein